jgi:hypothetical protein
MLATWARRILLSAPPVIALVLTVLIRLADRLHLRSEHVAGYCFLFGTPWAWLLDHNWFGNVHSRWLQSLTAYATILWIPALLYSACFWALLRLFRLRPNRVRN